MALNPNHTFEDLGEIKCSIVEKNCTPERVDFLRKLLLHNTFEVVVIKSPPPKTAKPAAVAPATENASADTTTAPEQLPPDTFTVGVTDLTFSPTNAVFNRELKTFEGAIVTAAYWKQQESAHKPYEWYWGKQL